MLCFMVCKPFVLYFFFFSFFLLTDLVYVYNSNNSMGRPLFEAHGISMQLDDNKRWLFKDIDIELNQREILVLQGPSGTG